MKTLLLIPALGLALLASSCRTETPIDPMTGKQSERCLPHYHHHCPAQHGCIHATK